MILEIGKMKYRAENLRVENGKATADVETFRDGKCEKARNEMTRVQRRIIDLAVQIYFDSGLSVAESLKKAQYYFFCKALSGEVEKCS